MFTPRRSAAQVYGQIGVETGVAAANPHKLVVMLFDGALLAVANAGRYMQERNIAERTRCIKHATNIIILGLKASLDKDKGGDLARNLDDLYDYMCTRLMHANATNDPGILDEVSQLLSDIRSAWLEIADRPEARGTVHGPTHPQPVNS